MNEKSGLVLLFRFGDISQTYGFSDHCLSTDCSSSKACKSFLKYIVTLLALLLVDRVSHCTVTCTCKAAMHIKYA